MVSEEFTSMDGWVGGWMTDQIVMCLVRHVDETRLVSLLETK